MELTELLCSFVLQTLVEGLAGDRKGGLWVSGDPTLTPPRVRMFLRVSAGTLSNCLPTWTGLGNSVLWHAL